MIRLIGQFLKEHNLTNTLNTLQEETQVGVNIIPSVEQLQQAIIESKWDYVFDNITELFLPVQQLQDLYELVRIFFILTSDF